MTLAAFGKSQAPPPNSSCSGAMICFGGLAWESCSTVRSCDGRSQGRTAARDTHRSRLWFAVQSSTCLVLYTHPTLTSPLLCDDLVPWTVATPLPPQAMLSIVHHGSVPTNSQLGSSSLRRPGSMKLFPKLKAFQPCT